MSRHINPDSGSICTCDWCAARNRRRLRIKLFVLFVLPVIAALVLFIV